MNEDELLAELQDRLENPPKFWTPEKVPEGMDVMECIDDDRIAGIVQTIDVRTSDFGEYLAIILKTSGGARVQVNGMGAVLKNKLEPVRIGDGLAILYKGRVEPKTAGYQAYADYHVERISMGSAVPRVIAEAESEASLNGNSLQGEGASDSVPHPAETA